MTDWTENGRNAAYAKMLGRSVPEMLKAAKRLKRKPQSLAARCLAGWCQECAATMARRDPVKCRATQCAARLKTQLSKRGTGGALHARTIALRKAGYASQAQAGRELGGSQAMIAARIRRGWCRDCAYIVPKGGIKPQCKRCGVSGWRKLGGRSNKARSVELGGNPLMVDYRLQAGWCSSCAKTIPKGQRCDKARASCRLKDGREKLRLNRPSENRQTAAKLAAVRATRSARDAGGANKRRPF